MSPAPPRLDRAHLATARRERGDAIAIPGDAVLDLPERAVQFGTGALLRGFIDDFLHRANQQGKFGGRIVAIASTGSVRDRALNEQVVSTRSSSRASTRASASRRSVSSAP